MSDSFHFQDDPIEIDPVVSLLDGITVNELYDDEDEPLSAFLNDEAALLSSEESEADDNKTAVCLEMSPIAPEWSPLTNQSVSPRILSPSEPCDPLQTQTESTEPEHMEGEDLTIATSGWFGFKVVGDNLDKNTRPRHQTIENRTVSLHYFNSYAVLDRINLSGVCDKRPILDPKTVTTKTVAAFLPTREDHNSIVANFTVLVARRRLIEHMPALSAFDQCVTKHITHKYSQEMSKTSRVVSFEYSNSCTILSPCGRQVHSVHIFSGRIPAAEFTWVLYCYTLSLYAASFPLFYPCKSTRTQI